MKSVVSKEFLILQDNLWIFILFQEIPKDELSGRSRFSIFLTSGDYVSRKSNYGLYGRGLLKTRW
jgi:hypothetical protein